MQTVLLRSERDISEVLDKQSAEALKLISQLSDQLSALSRSVMPTRTKVRYQGWEHFFWGPAPRPKGPLDQDYNHDEVARATEPGLEPTHLSSLVLKKTFKPSGFFSKSPTSLPRVEEIEAYAKRPRFQRIFVKNVHRGAFCVPHRMPKVLRFLFATIISLPAPRRGPNETFPIL